MSILDSAYLLTTYRNMHRRDLTHFFSKRQSDHALRWQINIQNAPKLRETTKNFESLMSISIKKSDLINHIFHLNNQTKWCVLPEMENNKWRDNGITYLNNLYIYGHIRYIVSFFWSYLNMALITIVLNIKKTINFSRYSSLSKAVYWGVLREKDALNDKHLNIYHIFYSHKNRFNSLPFPVTLRSYQW